MVTIEGCARVAHLAEQRIRNAQVAGSNPASGSIIRGQKECLDEVAAPARNSRKHGLQFTRNA